MEQMIVYMATKIDRKTGEITHSDPIEIDEEQFYRWAQPLFRFFIDKFTKENEQGEYVGGLDQRGQAI